MHPVPLHIPWAVSPYITPLWSGRPQGTHMGPLKQLFSKSRKSTFRLGFWTFSFILAQCAAATYSEINLPLCIWHNEARIFHSIFKVHWSLFLSDSPNRPKKSHQLLKGHWNGSIYNYIFMIRWVSEISEIQALLL